MELFQELIFTISLSLIVSLLIAKLFSVVSSSSDDDGGVSKRVVAVDEKEEWVVCDKDDKDVRFDDDGSDLGSGVVIDCEKSVGDDDADKVFDEKPERIVVEDVGAYKVFDESPVRKLEVLDDGLVGNDVECDLGSLVQADCVERNEVEDVTSSLLSSSAVDAGDVKVEEDVDDDWQGIETTELEKSFGAAVAFMGSKSSADRVNLIDNDVKIELYGLHKVANEGSCFEPQPMALKVAARANWNSWKRLENLGREDAMEQYIALLTRHVPDWMGTHASDKQ